MRTLKAFNSIAQGKREARHPGITNPNIIAAREAGDITSRSVARFVGS